MANETKKGDSMTYMEKVRYVLESCKCAILHSKTMGKEYPIIAKEIEEVLAVPLRNCDVGTAEEHAERFKKFCRNHQFISVESEDGFPPVYVCSNESCPLHDYYIAHGEDNCELAWAQTPYEAEEKGEGK